MIYEHRTYQITAGKVPEFLKLSMKRTVWGSSHDTLS